MLTGQTILLIKPATGLKLGPDGNAIEIAIEETLDGS